MVELKQCYEDAGMTNVSTLLQSGNVVFDCPKTDDDEVTEALESAVSQRFNYPAKILVLKKSELQPLADAYPFDSSNQDFQHYVIFVRAGMAKDLADAAGKLDPKTEAVQAGDGVVYWRVQKGMTLKTTFANVLTKQPFRDAHTNRNLNTVRKLLAT